MGDFKVNLPDESEMQSLTTAPQSTTPQFTIRQPRTSARRNYGRANIFQRFGIDKQKCVQWIIVFVCVSVLLGIVLFFNFRNFRPKKSDRESRVSEVSYIQHNSKYSHDSDDSQFSSFPNRKIYPNLKTNDPQNDQCHSQICNYSRILAVHMNLEANPCEDFHEYVCGHWNEHFDKNTSTHWRKRKPQIIVQVETALSETKRSNSKSVQYVIDLYNEYVNEKARSKLGVWPLHQLLKQVLGHEQWPLPNPVSPRTPSESAEEKISEQFRQFWNSDNADLVKDKLDYSAYYKFKIFWKSWMLWKSEAKTRKSTEPSDVGQWMDSYVEAFMVGIPSFVSIIGLDKKTLKLQANTITFLPLGSYEDVGTVYTKFKLLEAIVTLLFDLDVLHRDSDSVDNALYEVLDFYQAYSRLFPNQSDSESEAQTIKTSHTNMKSFTIAELNENHSSPEFDWKMLLNKFAVRTGASLRYTDSDTVRVQIDQIEALKPFTELLAKTPIRVLKNAMALRLIQSPSILNLLDAKHREIFGEETTIITVLFPGVNFVMQNFDEFMPIFVRLYADYVGRNKMINARDQVIEIMRHLKETFTDSLKHDHTWLDESTRQNALDKLEAMRLMIAFPDWIFDDEALDENFGFTKQTLYSKDTQMFMRGHYATSYLNFRRLAIGAEFRKNDQILPEDREFRFFKYNAAYAVEYNFIGVSYALLSEPWFNVDYPAAINYGNLGYIIAHEMMHAFDQEGRLYDKLGEKVNWWTDYTSEHFTKLSKCFVEQYDGLEDPTTGVLTNGTVKLSDNIADNGGLNQAYRAFQKGFKHKLSDFTLFEVKPSFKVHFTAEQLFFVSYGINWCSNGENSTEMAEFIHKDSHSPNKFRVNIPLSNMAQFANAFNCPVGSNMNPKHKCSIW